MRPARLSAADLVADTAYRWILPAQGEMRVPGVIFASKKLLTAALEDRSIEQVRNVASLPGIVKASYGMPDIHSGYGFPIGGVAATDVNEGGVVSPGGVGFDISCGVRLLVTSLEASEVRPQLTRLISALRRRVPAGPGPGGAWKLAERDLARVLKEGARAAVDANYGTAEDIQRCEEGGGLVVDDVTGVSGLARERGRRELGSLGSGNHFIEVQFVDEIFDSGIASSFGLRLHQVTVMIHTGSRGLGHQVCSEHVKAMRDAPHQFALPDPQLAATPVESSRGRRYLDAMAAAANFARANRQVLTWAVRKEIAALFPREETTVVYDVSHNLAKLESHEINGVRKLLCVHRKGATRALPAGHADLPALYIGAGQPVLTPGSMGTASYVLVGEAGGEAFASTCHGAGRTMSRHKALQLETGEHLKERLRERGIVIEAKSLRELSEESPEAYKDVDEVIRTCQAAGLSRPVARLRPMGVLKG